MSADGGGYNFNRDRTAKSGPVGHFERTEQSTKSASAAQTRWKDREPIVIDWGIWYPRWRRIMDDFYD